MKIAFFEIKQEEQAFFESQLKEHELYFFEETIQSALKETKEYEIVSVFVHSRMSDEIIDRLPNLVYVQTRSTGYEHLICKKLYKKGISVSNVAGYGGPAVAEFAFSLLLNVTRKTYTALERCKNGDFHYLDLKGIELFGKTIGIVGLGTIGLHMAKIAKGFGMKILGYSRTYDPIFETLDIEFIALEALLKNADVLMLAVPLTPSTRDLINTTNAQYLKKDAIIINIARKEIIENTLYHTLPNTIASDIDQNSALLDKENILQTPHMAYYTKEALNRILDISVLNMQQFIKGDTPQNCLRLQCKKEYD